MSIAHLTELEGVVEIVPSRPSTLDKTMKRWTSALIATSGVVLLSSLLLLQPGWPAGADHARAAEATNASPVIPAMGDRETKGLRRIFQRGLRAGNRPKSFIKVGDSISWTSLFLQGFSCGEGQIGKWSALKKTIRWHRGLRLPGWAGHADCRSGGDDPFGRDSAAARPNQFSAWPLSSPPFYEESQPADPHCRVDEAPLACEWRLLRPATALVMVGTNDAGPGVPAETVRTNVAAITEWLLSRGTIPVLSTIPPRLDGPSEAESALSYNEQIRNLGRERRVPVIDLNRALTAKGMIAKSMEADGVHPSALGGPNCWFVNERCRSTDLRPGSLRYGHNLRNLITLRTLDLLRRNVIAPVLGKRSRG